MSETGFNVDDWYDFDPQDQYEGSDPENDPLNFNDNGIDSETLIIDSQSQGTLKASLRCCKADWLSTTVNKSATSVWRRDRSNSASTI